MKGKEPDFYYVTGDKGSLIGFWKHEENIPLPETASMSWDVHEGYFLDDVIYSSHGQCEIQVIKRKA